MKKARSFWVIVLTVALIFSMGITADASINWGNAVYISSYGQVVDSINYNGKVVNAVYAPRNQVSNYDSDTTFCCAAFVKRFYSTIYGITVNNLYPGNTPNVASGGGSFYKTSTPQVGDIAGSSGHWAIVKAVSGNTITLIEQNCWNNTSYTHAQVGRKITLPESSYWYWRYSGAGSSAPPSTSSSWETSVTEVTMTNAKLYAKYNVGYKVQFQWAGCNIFDANGTMIAQAGENTGWKSSWLEIYYYVNSDTYNKLQLQPGTTYKYQFYATHDGVDHFSPMYTFKTVDPPHTHSYSSTVTKNPTCVVEGVRTYSCSCGNSYTGTIQAKGHTYVNSVVEPTYTTKGYTLHRCIACGSSYSDTYVDVLKPQRVSIKRAKVTLGESDNTYTYTGKGRNPAVKSVTVAGKKLVANRDYTVSYKNNKNIGTGTVIIKGKGNYTGTFNKSFKIVPKKATLKTATAASSTKATITWNKISHAKGYQVVLATNKSFTKNKKVINVKSYKTVKTTVSKLKSRKAYYVKVRAYKTVSGTKYYGAYSSVKLVTPKKATVSKVKSTSKKKATVTWKKDSYASGYQIVVATNKGFTKNKKTTTVSSYKTVKKTISKLKSKKTYYVKVRAYKTVSGKKYYGAYSSVKKIKVR